MTLKKNIFALVLFVLLCSLPGQCLGIEVYPLKELLDQGGQATVIDIRNHELYKAGHIPGAINISATVIADKRLPPLGPVVVCGDGFNQDTTLQAVEALEGKQGISADFLEGGYPAWISLNLPVVVLPGMKNEQYNYVTYQELQKAAVDNNDIVLVDIRRIAFGSNKKTLEDEEKLTDLAELFPDLEIIRPASGASRTGSKERQVSLALFQKRGNMAYVIIGNGRGQAEILSQRLNQAGIRRNYILTGGEFVLRKKGKSADRIMTFDQTP